MLRISKSHFLQIYVVKIINPEHIDEIRPAIVMEYLPCVNNKKKSKFSLAPITHKPPICKPKKYRPYYYQVNEWKLAGLDKPSWINTAYLIDYPADKIFKKLPCGMLTNVDIYHLFLFMMEHQ